MPPVALNTRNMKRLVAFATHNFFALMTFGGPECGLQTRSRWESEWFNSTFEATYFLAAFPVNDRTLVRIRTLQRNAFQNVLVLYTTPGPLGLSTCIVLGSIVVSIPACHAGDQGSIPCRGDIFYRCVIKQPSFLSSRSLRLPNQHISFPFVVTDYDTASFD